MSKLFSVITLTAMGTSQAFAFDLCDFLPGLPWCTPTTPPGGGSVSVPEPMSLVMLTIGLVVVGALIMYRRRKRI